MGWPKRWTDRWMVMAYGILSTQLAAMSCLKCHWCDDILVAELKIHHLITLPSASHDLISQWQQSLLFMTVNIYNLVKFSLFVSIIISNQCRMEWMHSAQDRCRSPAATSQAYEPFNPLTPSVAIWVQLWSILCQTGLRVICNFWHPGTLTLSTERQSARMSKITNDGSTRSGTECFIAYGNSELQMVKCCDFLLHKQWITSLQQWWQSNGTSLRTTVVPRVLHCNFNDVIMFTLVIEVSSLAV